MLFGCKNKRGLKMKKSTAMLTAAFLAMGILSTSAMADGDAKKGQKLYLKKCKKCHGNGTKGAAMKTQDEWSELFDDGAAGIIAAHKGDKSEAFFKGDKFQKLAPDLKAFLYEYGSDSGNVPSCG
jgi:cytochrome c2